MYGGKTIAESYAGEGRRAQNPSLSLTAAAAFTSQTKIDGSRPMIERESSPPMDPHRPPPCCLDLRPSGSPNLSYLHRCQPPDRLVAGLTIGPVTNSFAPTRKPRELLFSHASTAHSLSRNPPRRSMPASASWARADPDKHASHTHTLAAAAFTPSNLECQ